MNSGDTVRCVIESEVVDLKYGHPWERRVDIKRGINYLVILNRSGKLKLLGVRGYFKASSFELREGVNYATIPWFLTDYSKCGTWVLINNSFWSVRHASNKYGGPRHRRMEGALFVDPHSKEIIY